MRWSKKDVVRLKALIEKHGVKGLKEIYKEEFPGRTLSSVRNKIRRLKKVKSTPDEIIAAPAQELNEEKKREKILELVKKGPISLRKLSEEELGSSHDGVIKLIDSLRSKGYDINIRKKVDEDGNSVWEVFLDREAEGGKSVVLDGVGRKEIKFLVISDTGFGLKDHQPELTATALEKAEEEKVNFAIHAGNITGGKATKTTEQDFLSDKDVDQIAFANKMPRKSFKMYFLNGPRDLKHKQKKGKNPARTLCQDRDDYRYEGDLEANFIIKGLKVKVVHVKDRVTYSKSYTAQGIRENQEARIHYVYQDKKKPDLLIVGGTHAYIYLPAKKTKDGISVIGLPSLHGITPDQEARKKRGGFPELGYVIVTVKLDKQGRPEAIEHECYPLTAYQIARNAGTNIKYEGLSEKEKAILDFIKSRPRRLGELSNHEEVDMSKSRVKKVIEKLIDQGYDIHFDSIAGKYFLTFDWREREFKPLNLKTMFKHTLKTASFSDTHVGNRSARLDLIPKVYEIAEREKVDVITHSGDVFDGQDAYRGHEQELKEHGADVQRKKALEIWPKSKIPTLIITGSSHELVYETRSGHNVVETFVEIARLKGYNIEYIGGRDGLEGSKMINGVGVKLIHPKGGVPYAKSYRLQKFIENSVEEKADLDRGDRLILMGHLHISMAMLYKGVVAFLVPCLEEQTCYLKGKGLYPWLGMWVIEITLDEHKNVTRLRPKYISFENKKEKKD